MSLSPSTPRRWDIFCRVVDNFGDIGVCWRLARQLALEHGLQVRLWVDDLVSLALLNPAVDAKLEQQITDRVEICRWSSDFSEVTAADIVIEAFACELPASYLAAMAAAPKMPGWVNLEYLSAEPWVESCHGIASPHPTLALIKHFFFPGFTQKTGGLLHEAGLLAHRDTRPTPYPPPHTLQVSLFCYDTAPVGALLEAWANGPNAIHCRVAAGKPSAAVKHHLGPGDVWEQGNLRIEAIPFLSQLDYDHLLWQSDLNFVRGEDSFVRAQWAAKPLVWQLYPQDESAHLEKLDAFLERYTGLMPSASQSAVGALFHAWNNDGRQLAQAWQDYRPHLPTLRQHGEVWTQQLASLGNLAENLVKFCTCRI